LDWEFNSVVEPLPGKQKTLGSIPSTEGRKEGKKRWRKRREGKGGKGRGGKGKEGEKDKKRKEMEGRGRE
jgi:hypothetical protein